MTSFKEKKNTNFTPGFCIIIISYFSSLAGAPPACFLGLCGCYVSSNSTVQLFQNHVSFSFPTSLLFFLYMFLNDLIHIRALLAITMIPKFTCGVWISLLYSNRTANSI